MIPYLDLKNINLRYEAEILEATRRLLHSGQYILGKELESFEENFASYCGTKFCIGTGNGLDALHLIFRGLIETGKLRESDEILVPANTYIASILSILSTGLVPRLVEADPESYNLTLDAVRKNFTDKTKGIMMVHLYGHITDGKKIKKFADENGLFLIEDAAQAHGAREDNSQAGAIGHAAAFSFYPGKNLGCLGDGGAVTTDCLELAECIRALRNYGSVIKYHHKYKGINSRLDDLQAGILNLKLKDLDRDNERRRQIAKIYTEEIKNSAVKLPCWDGSSNHVFHIFAIRTAHRDRLRDYLEQNSVQTLIHYPIPPHHQNAMAEYSELKLPISEKIHREILSLPCHPLLSDGDARKIVHLINQF